jgi:rod shape determining protein RodA
MAGLHWKYSIAVVTMLVLPGGLVFSEGLSAGAAGPAFSIRIGPAGRRVSVDSVPDGHRGGRDVRQGSHQGNPDPAPLPAGAAQGFHLLGLCRGARICWRSVVLALYFVMIMRIVQNAQTAPDGPGCTSAWGWLRCCSRTSWSMWGWWRGLMPVTGIPLPFMSAGGSSIWSSFLALGLVNNVRLRRFVN